MSNATAQRLLRMSGLRPIATSLGTGRCACQPAFDTMLYRKGSTVKCDACFILTQKYPYPGERATDLRLGTGQFMLITETTTTFWGRHHLSALSKRIECRPPAGMRLVMRDLILRPPPPPWLYICFDRSNRTDRLVATEDNAVLRFVGHEVNDVPVQEVNRTQVLEMYEVGMTKREWDTYLGAYANGSVDAVKTMQAIAEKHPAIDAVRYLPCQGAPEHLMLKTLLED